MFGRKKRRISRLLIVEDEPLVAFDTEHFLREGDFQIVATLDRVADALTVIERDEPIDLVLVDLNLADGSGVDVARAAFQRGIAVIFVTGASPDGGRDVATGCLTKPYAPRDMIAAIRAVEMVLDGKTPKKLPSGFSLFDRAA